MVQVRDYVALMFTRGGSNCRTSSAFLKPSAAEAVVLPVEADGADCVDALLQRL